MVTLGTDSVGKMSRAVARLAMWGRSWLPTSRKTGTPSRDKRAMRLANSRWCVCDGSRLL